MSRYSFTLQVPAEPAYETLAREVLARFFEGLGAEPVRAAAFAAELEQALRTVSPGADSVELTVERDPAVVAVTLAAGGRQAHVRHSLS